MNKSQQCPPNTCYQVPFFFSFFFFRLQHVQGIITGPGSKNPDSEE